MKEFFAILFTLDLNKIFREPSKNVFLQFFRYAFVGGVATVVDWGVLFLAEKLMEYLIAAIIGFFAGLAVNFALSKMFVFSAEETNVNAAGEFGVYAAIGAVGLAMTELILYFFTEKMGLYFMLSKVIATAIVFVWNFAARKLILYRGQKG